MEVSGISNIRVGFMFILSITLPNLSIPDVLFPALFSTLIIRGQFQVKPATLLIPIDFFLVLLMEQFYGTRYQSGSPFLTYCGEWFLLPA
jgi:hypothetical protein